VLPTIIAAWELLDPVLSFASEAEKPLIMFGTWASIPSGAKALSDFAAFMARRPRGYPGRALSKPLYTNWKTAL